TAIRVVQILFIELSSNVSDSESMINRRAPFSLGLGMSASHPSNARVRGGAYPIPELSHMMLKMTKTDDLMFYLGDLVPKESTVRVGEIERIDGTINRAIANVPIDQYFFLCVWFSCLGRTMRQFADARTVRRALLVIHELNSGLVMFPWTKGIRI